MSVILAVIPRGTYTTRGKIFSDYATVQGLVKTIS
jgi:hypothetical protein